MTRHEGNQGGAAANERFPTSDKALAEVACGNADFERLKAMMDEQIQQDVRRSRGTLKMVSAGILAVSALVATLMGGGSGGLNNLVETATLFKTETKGVAGLPAQASGKLAAQAFLPKSFEADGTKNVTRRPFVEGSVLSAQVARAASVVYSNGRQVGRGGHFDVRLTAVARQALRSVGVDVPPRSSSASLREAALVRGLGRLTEAVGSLEAALACLRVEREVIETALDLAYGSNIEHPGRFDSFARYLPHAARRRAEGPTKRVMALSIGYDMQWPAPESARVSSGFGPRIHPVLGEAMWHYGTDLAVDEGTVIRAMAAGHVLYSREDAVNGKFVKLDHGYGLTSAYVHNSKLLVGVGQKVKKGQAVALSGASGRATGPHLHFQVELDERPIDPETFRERKAPRAHHQSIEAEAIGEADLPSHVHLH